MFERVRAGAGRVATVAGSAVLAGSLFTDSLTVTAGGIAAVVVTAGAGLATNSKIVRADSSARGTAIAVYCAPHGGAAAMLLGEPFAPGDGAWMLAQAGVVTVWTGATWLLRPGKAARDLVGEMERQEATDAAETASDETPAQEDPAEAAPAQPAAPQDRMRRWWAQEVAVEGGAAPGTVLVDHDRVSEQCVALIYAAAQRGRAAPQLSKATLSAHLDLPLDQIEDGPVPGRGAGVRLLLIGPRPQPAEDAAAAHQPDEELWRDIAASAMPGVELIEVNTYEMRKELT